ncbi:MAG: hypothetical protein JXO51_03500 [Candidatus Aminicenantes bacterium]|nr:hypothetical protein [Candidatus Aminicenantes bacterium]
MARNKAERNLMARGSLRPLFSLKKNGGLSLLFLLLIFLPLADMVFTIAQPLALIEKRKLAAVPRFSWSRPWDFPRQAESYFNDHFGLRSHLVHWHNRLMVQWFDASPTDKVIVGRRGWLFMGRETKTRDELDYYRSLTPLSPSELRQWRQTLCQRRDWLAGRNIRYIFLVVPNKSTIYPEYMPGRFRRLHPRSRLDQLLAELEREKDFPVLDVRPELQRAKERYTVYNRTDSHWNELGAYFAYERILGRLAADFPGLPRPSLDQFAIESTDWAGGDLAQMLSLHKKYYRERAIRLRYRGTAEVTALRSRRSLGPYVRETITECATAPLPGMVMVHDSFAHQLKPLLNPRFRRIVYIWDWRLRFFKDVIEEERPAVVIDEMAERALCDLVPENPPGLGLAPAP